MVQVLADIHMVEAQVEMSVPAPDTAVMVFNKYHGEIMQRYEITPEEFKRSYQYYARNLEEMDKLYEIILDTLTAREAKFETHLPRKPKTAVQDSIKTEPARPDTSTIMNREASLRKLRNTPLIRVSPSKKATSGTL